MTDCDPSTIIAQRYLLTIAENAPRTHAEFSKLLLPSSASDKESRILLVVAVSLCLQKMTNLLQHAMSTLEPEDFTSTLNIGGNLAAPYSLVSQEPSGVQSIPPVRRILNEEEEAELELLSKWATGKSSLVRISHVPLVKESQVPSVEPSPAIQPQQIKLKGGCVVRSMTKDGPRWKVRVFDRNGDSEMDGLMKLTAAMLGAAVCPAVNNGKLGGGHQKRKRRR